MFIAFFSFYKVYPLGRQGDLEKGYVSFFLAFFYFVDITFSRFVQQFFLVHQSCKPNLSAASLHVKTPKTQKSNPAHMPDELTS